MYISSISTSADQSDATSEKRKKHSKSNIPAHKNVLHRHCISKKKNTKQIQVRRLAGSGSGRVRGRGRGVGRKEKIEMRLLAGSGSGSGSGWVVIGGVLLLWI
jgi:hypothetical protein